MLRHWALRHNHQVLPMVQVLVPALELELELVLARHQLVMP